MGRVITNDVNEIVLNIKRFLARVVDWGIYILICSWILYSVFNVYYLPMDEMLKLLVKYYAYFAYIIMIFIEPLLLKFFGTTPGKFICGLYVYTVNENKLSYQEGISREVKYFSMEWV